MTSKLTNYSFGRKRRRPPPQPPEAPLLTTNATPDEESNTTAWPTMTLEKDLSSSRLSLGSSCHSLNKQIPKSISEASPIQKISTTGSTHSLSPVSTSTSLVRDAAGFMERWKGSNSSPAPPSPRPASSLSSVSPTPSAKRFNRINLWKRRGEKGAQKSKEQRQRKQDKWQNEEDKQREEGGFRRLSALLRLDGFTPDEEDDVSLESVVTNDVGEASQPDLSQSQPKAVPQEKTQNHDEKKVEERSMLLLRRESCRIAESKLVNKMKALTNSTVSSSSSLDGDGVRVTPELVAASTQGTSATAATAATTTTTTTTMSTNVISGERTGESPTEIDGESKASLRLRRAALERRASHRLLEARLRSSLQVVAASTEMSPSAPTREQRETRTKAQQPQNSGPLGATTVPSFTKSPLQRKKDSLRKAELEVKKRFTSVLGDVSSSSFIPPRNGVSQHASFRLQELRSDSCHDDSAASNNSSLHLSCDSLEKDKRDTSTNSTSTNTSNANTLNLNECLNNDKQCYRSKDTNLFAPNLDDDECDENSLSPLSSPPLHPASSSQKNYISGNRRLLPKSPGNIPKNMPIWNKEDDLEETKGGIPAFYPNASFPLLGDNFDDEEIIKLRRQQHQRQQQQSLNEFRLWVRKEMSDPHGKEQMKEMRRLTIEAAAIQLSANRKDEFNRESTVIEEDSFHSEKTVLEDMEVLANIGNVNDDEKSLITNSSYSSFKTSESSNSSQNMDNPHRVGTHLSQMGAFSDESEVLFKIVVKRNILTTNHFKTLFTSIFPSSLTSFWSEMVKRIVLLKRHESRRLEHQILVTLLLLVVIIFLHQYSSDLTSHFESFLHGTEETVYAVVSHFTPPQTASKSLWSPPDSMGYVGLFRCVVFFIWLLVFKGSKLKTDLGAETSTSTSTVVTTTGRRTCVSFL